MDTNKNIVIGEWFCADLGIAIAERFHVYYYEEYNNIPEGKKVGDYRFKTVEYKQFCDYHGKPTRRNRFKECNIEYCDTLDKEWEKVLNDSIKNHPKEYESFKKFLKEVKHTYDDIIVYYEVPEDKKIRPIAHFAGCDHVQIPILTRVSRVSNVSEHKSMVEIAQ